MINIDPNVLPDFAEIMKRRLSEPELGAARRELLEERLREIAPTYTQNAFRQLIDTYKDRGVSCSSLGKCRRALAFMAHGVKASDDIDARARLTFAAGDQIESFIVLALWEALETMGLPWVLKDSLFSAGGQKRIAYVGTIDGEGREIGGSKDGLLTGSVGGRIINVVLEVKSASDYACKRWEDAKRNGHQPWDASESYWWQNQAYQAAENADAGYVIVQNKANGHCFGFYVPRDPSFDQRVAYHLDGVWSRDPNDVPRVLPDGERIKPEPKISEATGKPLKGHGKLPWQCQYCGYSGACHGDRAYTDLVGGRNVLIVKPEFFHEYE